MKRKTKLSVIISALGLALGITSCEKDWTCTCTYDGDSYAETFQNISKKDAKDICNGMEAYLRAEGYSDASCKLN